MRWTSWTALIATLFAVAAAACTKPHVDPIRLDGNLLTAQNQTDRDWTDVEIWINWQFRVTVKRLQAGQVFRAPLDHFVEAYGRQFKFSQMQIKDVRLKAKDVDGKPIEIVKQFESNSLSDALKGIGGSR